MSSIRLSRKHGLNPSMGLCFWCKEPDGTVLLVGAALGDDKEAPRYMLASYEPCARCKAMMEQGITLIEANQGHPAGIYDKKGRAQEIAPGIVPTGNWSVIKDTSVEAFFNDPKMIESVLRHRKAFVEPGVLEKLNARYKEDTGKEPPHDLPKEKSYGK